MCHKTATCIAILFIKNIKGFRFDQKFFKTQIYKILWSFSVPSQVGFAVSWRPINQDQ